MTRRARLNEAELDRIAHLTEARKLTDCQIARMVGCSPGSVAWAKLRIGADKHPDKPLPPVPAERVTQIRNGRPVHRFTRDDDAQLLKLEAEGLNYAQIGRRLDPARLHNSIQGRLLTLSRRAARAEHVQQQAAA